MNFNVPLVTVLSDVIKKSADPVRDYRDRRFRLTESVTRDLDAITEDDPFMVRLDGEPSLKVLPSSHARTPPAANGTGRARLMKRREMVERGLLPVGTVLTIRDRADSASTVVDGKRVEFRGEVMSYNAWGCAATGWSAIQIYKWAVLPDGRLLEALREVPE